MKSTFARAIKSENMGAHMQKIHWPWSSTKPVRLFPGLTILLSFLSVQAVASPLDPDRAGAFLRGLLDHPNSMEEFIDAEDLEVAGRLGISYPEAPCKPLISWDLSMQARDLLRQGGIDGQFTIEELDDRHSRLILFPHDPAVTKSWIFRDSKVISSILHGVGDWKIVDSTHFRFFISDSSLFHVANIEALESFLAEQAMLLGMSDKDLDQLSKEKIYYCFCRNADEIRELTGHVARGMYIVSHDIIVSTYSAHFHELAHLLINFKLKKPHLFTHPFFLEGFAVAVGGRGGKSPEILQQLGLSLYRSGWISLDEMLDASGFYSQNASLSYPGSAPYNRFLLDHLGISGYLALYKKYGGDGQTVARMKINRGDLPAETEWLQYLELQPHEGAAGPGAQGLDLTHGPVAFQPLPGNRFLGFVTPEMTLAMRGPTSEEYRSILFEQLIDNHPYEGERILIRVSSEEVGVYDLYTNTMIAHYAWGLSESKIPIPIVDGLFVFHVDRSVFPGGLKDLEYQFGEGVP